MEGALKELAVLLTAHNRRETTLDGLRGIALALAAAGRDADVYLVDDGSTDGTANAVGYAFPGVHIIRHAGGLFWCRGMHLAWSTARRAGYRWYLWLNDDTALFPDSVARLLGVAELLESEGNPGIVVGATADRSSGRLTYSGLRRVWRWHRTNFAPVTPTDRPESCDTMNGNVVLVPEPVCDRIGLLEPQFEHAMGDFDYGLRARQAGIPIVLAPGHVGTCSRNAVNGTFNDVTLGLGSRWKHMMSPKGLPPRSWYLYTRRHGGWLWPAYFGWPYVRVVLSSLFNAGKG